MMNVDQRWSQQGVSGSSYSFHSASAKQWKKDNIIKVKSERKELMFVVERLKLKKRQRLKKRSLPNRPKPPARLLMPKQNVKGRRLRLNC